jgi:hypothetical protein
MDNISISLPLQAWNLILTILGDRSFKEVADLIMEIKRQAESQLPAAPAASPVDAPVAQEEEATMQ